MVEIVRSLWLPVGRENFYSAMTDPTLALPGTRQELPRSLATGTFRSNRLGVLVDYIPHLRESVLRRLLEVLPDSFGYGADGVCEFCDEPDESDRPISVTLVLTVGPEQPRLIAAATAHDRLRTAGVSTVRLRVDENGFYTFAAHGPGEETAQAAAALEEHIVALFGGTFVVERLSPPKAGRRPSEGTDAVRRYNGLAPLPQGTPGADAYGRETTESRPLGALSFFQLNIMAESLCNQSLLPAVFFEHYEDSRAWLERTRRRVSVITHLDDFIRVIIKDVDARTLDGQTSTVRRFLVISRGSLQWMRRSVDSVRRSLLDQMMAVSHRSARLIQLDLAGIRYEWTPELAREASESQMRGYVVLIATKLPLLQNVAECAQAAVAALVDSAGADEESGLGDRVHDLNRLTRHWTRLLRDLRRGVENLADAVGQDWQERMLYEQEQALSEQQAMAEIERSRRGLPDRRRTGDLFYNAMMLILTAVTVVVAVPAVDDARSPDQGLVERLLHLWPLAPLTIGILLLLWGMNATRRFLRQRRPDNENYGYEFAFRMDESASAKKIHDWLMRSTTKAELRSFGRTKVRPLGGWRSDKISPESELVKLHSVAVVRLRRRPFRYARFEIVVEVLVRRISGERQHFVRHCRVFGDSPRPIGLEQLETLVSDLVKAACQPLVSHEFDVKTVTALTDGIYHGRDNGAAPPPTGRRLRRLRSHGRRGTEVPVQRQPTHDKLTPA